MMQLGEGERLGEVVVRTGLEVLHLLFRRIARGQYQNRYLLVAAPDAAQELADRETFGSMRSRITRS